MFSAPLDRLLEGWGGGQSFVVSQDLSLYLSAFVYQRFSVLGPFHGECQSQGKPQSVAK